MRYPWVPTGVRGRLRSKAVLHLEFDATGDFALAIHRLEQTFHNSAYLADLIKRAAAETILVAVRKRFIESLPNALEMIVAPDPTDSLRFMNARQHKTEEMAHYLELQNELSEAHLTGSASKVLAVQSKIQTAKKRLLQAYNRDQRGYDHSPRWSSLSSGKFRARALRVLQELTDLGAMQVSAGANGQVTVSLGNTDRLNAIGTPSAVQYVFQKGPTRSPYNTLWRHLEFGTGAYASDPEGKDHPNTRYSLPGGMWWLPTGKEPNAKERIVLEGSRGMHFLRTATGLMYDQDADRFRTVLGFSLLESLRGTSELAVA